MNFLKRKVSQNTGNLDEESKDQITGNSKSKIENELSKGIVKAMSKKDKESADTMFGSL